MQPILSTAFTYTLLGFLLGFIGETIGCKKECNFPTFLLVL